MDIVIKEVLSGKELKDFILFPHKLYANNSFWVPSLLSDEKKALTQKKNPAFEYCKATYWLAYKGNEVVGRIAGIINETYIQKWGKRYARFGWLDFIDDANVSKALLDTVESWALNQSMVALHGPLGFTDFDPEGMLIEGFDKVSTMTTLYNYPYYPGHLEKLEYRKDVDWAEYEIAIPTVIPACVSTIALAAASKLKLQVLEAKTPRALLPYASGVFALINKSYADLYGVVPLTSSQINAYTKQYFSFIRPEYVSLILQHDVVVAFAIAIPSLSKALQKAKGRLFPFGYFYLYQALQKNSLVDLYLIGVDPKLQGKGVTALLIKDLGEKLIKNNVTKAVTHPILEQNAKMAFFWRGYRKQIFKRRRCYIKVLNKSNGDRFS